MKNWLILGLGLVALMAAGAGIGIPGIVEDFVVQKIAEAIAFAEGFYSPGSRPARNNNPGDFETDITGKGVAKDGPYVIYATIADGWEALYKEVRLMFKGSHIYSPDMTILDVARHYTATDQQAWAANVAIHLGVTTSTKLSEIV